MSDMRKYMKYIWRFFIIIWLVLLTQDVQATISSIGHMDLMNDKLLKLQSPFKSHGVHKAVCTVTVNGVSATAEAEATSPLKNGDEASTSIEELKSQINYLQNLLYNEFTEMRNFLRDCSCSCRMDNTSPTVTQYNNDMSSKKIFKQPPLSLKSGNVGSSNDKLLKKKISSSNLENGATKLGSDSLFYTYRWKLKELTKHLLINNASEVESDEFSIAGRAMKIKIYFHYLQREYLFIQLIEVPLNMHNNTESNRITLDINGNTLIDRGDGTIFKEISKDNNQVSQFKYKISILNQSIIEHPNLMSQLFNTYESGFSVPTSALIDSLYVRGDSLLIQIHFYT